MSQGKAPRELQDVGWSSETKHRIIEWELSASFPTQISRDGKELEIKL